MTCGSCGGSLAEMNGAEFCSSQCAELARVDTNHQLIDWVAGDSQAVADMMLVAARTIAARRVMIGAGNELADRIISIHDEVVGELSGQDMTYRNTTNQWIDSSSPDTSYPYFLDLIDRIDAATDDRGER